MSKEVRTAGASTKSKHNSQPVVQRRGPSIRSRSHAKATPDGRYKCVECGFISCTLEEADAHHFRTHERQPPMHTRIRRRKTAKYKKPTANTES